ncbi:sensor histidine kinase [Paracoccus benzoatiresistens]|uniref:histidine kinase n=1 Tax=Paracoccus benzoatiresistens TaxID=2997341 RepID=A0ABT4J5T3_9RHOB|nr:ATP-binding protein [Paracoccus sp. EF6]MCZ0962259.1 ATP-binding protein [Paracoccus sp. EF6]
MQDKQDTSPTTTDSPVLSRAAGWLVLALALALLVLVPAATFWGVRAGALQGLRDEGLAAAQSRAMTLESILDRQRAVVAILSDDAIVKATLRGAQPGGNLVSAKLERLRAATQSSVLYLLDGRGRTVAASNWNQPDSFVGHNYSFRDYFRLARPTAMEFALGTVSREPGLYLSHDVRVGAALLGVVVVKVEFDTLEAAWARSPNATHVTDANGRVIITTDAELRFRTAPPAAPDSLPIALPVRGTGWTLAMHVPTREVRQTAAYAAGSAGLATLLLMALANQARRARLRAALKARADRAYRVELEHAVAERTRDLSDEIRERQLAQQRLSQMQSDLVQANKLATMGQITAGVAHEINQPLATIRLLAENGQAMAPGGPASDNLARISRMTDRIGQITDQLRDFARKATGEIGPVSLRPVIEASMLLTASLRKASDMPVHLPEIPEGLAVTGERVRVEQILVNLLTNASEAQEGRADAWIRIGVQADADRVTLTVSDNGPGLSPQVRDQLFAPFATSKAQGLGLGLVISRDIAREFGGELSADDPVPGQGATFRLVLRRSA